MNVTFISSSSIKPLADKVFEEQKTRILNIIPNADIQHIGSTSIVGSITKGDLDINIRVKQDEFKKAIKELKKLYEINQPENWTEHYASFKDDKSLGIAFGAQLVVIDSPYDFFIKQRDKLNSNPQLIEEYNVMKQKYEGGDIAEYRIEKSKFFEKILEI